MSEERINGFTREEAVEQAFRVGFEGETNRFSCPQCSFNAITEVLGYRSPQMFRAMEPLEGGGAITGKNSCGAFSGSLAAIGFFLGRDYDRFNRGEKDRTASGLGRKVYDKFAERYGTAICGQILTRLIGFEVDFDDEELREKFEEAGGHARICPTIVGLAAAWTVDLLWDVVPKDKDLSSIPAMDQADSLQNL
jgi:C_GCAxxG_C_C family probable redox protein